MQSIVFWWSTQFPIHIVKNLVSFWNLRIICDNLIDFPRLVLKILFIRKIFFFSPFFFHLIKSRNFRFMVFCMKCRISKLLIFPYFRLWLERAQVRFYLLNGVSKSFGLITLLLFFLLSFFFVCYLFYTVFVKLKTLLKTLVSANASEMERNLKQKEKWRTDLVLFFFFTIGWGNETTWHLGGDWNYCKMELFIFWFTFWIILCLNMLF